jgi:hypothetical protein
MQKSKKKSQNTIDKHRKEVYSDLLNHSSKNLFKLVLFSPPSIENLDSDLYKESKKFYGELSGKLSNVYYIDYKEFQKNRGLWSDFGHLNLNGANLLSQKLSLFLKKNEGESNL